MCLNVKEIFCDNSHDQMGMVEIEKMPTFMMYKNLLIKTEISANFFSLTMKKDGLKINNLKYVIG